MPPVDAISSSSQSLWVKPPRAAAGQLQLSPQEQAQVRRLQQIDRKVREHEAAHQSAGAGLTGGAQYRYVRGPDGKQYAVSGEVKIDVSPAQTPQQTLEKARRIQAAALAPADPSSQDRAVAAQAAQMAAEAQAALRDAQQGGQNRSNNTQTALAAYRDTQPAPEPLISLFA